MANAVWAAVPEPVSSLTQNMKPYELPPLCFALLWRHSALVAVTHQAVFLQKGYVASGAAAVVLHPVFWFKKTFNINLISLISLLKQYL